jgi:hypothetical protein
MRGQPLREIMSDSPSMMEGTKLNQGMNLAETVKIARAGLLVSPPLSALEVLSVLNSKSFPNKS